MPASKKIRRRNPPEQFGRALLVDYQANLTPESRKKSNDRSRLISVAALASNFSTCLSCGAVAIIVSQHTENQSRQQKQRSYAVDSFETREDSPFFQPMKSFR
jgi:hypothetical protein